MENAAQDTVDSVGVLGASRGVGRQGVWSYLSSLVEVWAPAQQLELWARVWSPGYGASCWVCFKGSWLEEGGDILGVSNSRVASLKAARAVGHYVAPGDEVHFGASWSALRGVGGQSAGSHSSWVPDASMASWKSSRTEGLNL